jgi:hypothetical protein
MPTFKQGDIFSDCHSDEYGLAIVFGHLGYNFLRPTWENFSKKYANLSSIEDPFSQNANQPLEYRNGCWIIFIPDADRLLQRRGMTDEKLIETLSSSFEWASARAIKKIITNGIQNVDHAQSPLGATAINRDSDNRRTKFLIDIINQYEKTTGMALTLISLNDVFLRDTSKN